MFTVSDELAPCTTLDEVTPAGPITADSPGVRRAYDAMKSAPGSREDRRRLFGSVSGLSPAHVHKAVNMTLQAAVLALHHAPAIHYTQGAERWQGIDRGLKAWRGEYPTEADCSAFATWCLWNGLDHFHHSDTVNGQRWRAGFTGTLLQHGRRVRSPRPADLIIYGRSWPGDHTAVYTGGGLVVSHGTEAGPNLVRWNQMGIPVLSVRRYL